MIAKSCLGKVKGVAQKKSIAAPLRNKLALIEKTKQAISDQRDILRNQIDELNDILESCDEAVSMIEDGQRAFEDAADELSKYL